MSDRAERTAKAVEDAVRRMLAEVLTGSLLRTHRLWEEAERAAEGSVDVAALAEAIARVAPTTPETGGGAADEAEGGEANPDDGVWQVVDDHVSADRLEAATDQLCAKVGELIRRELRERIWDLRQVATDSAMHVWKQADGPPPTPFLLGPEPSRTARICALEVLALDGDEDAALLLHRLAVAYELPPHPGKVEVQELDGACTGDETVKKVICCGPCYSAGCIVEIGREVKHADGFSRLSSTSTEMKAVNGTANGTAAAAEPD